MSALSTSTPSSQSFFSLLESRCKEIDSLLCVGLDPHRAELNVSATATEMEVSDAAFSFCKTLIDKTLPFAGTYDCV